MDIDRPISLNNGVTSRDVNRLCERIDTHLKGDVALADEVKSNAWQLEIAKKELITKDKQMELMGSDLKFKDKQITRLEKVNELSYIVLDDFANFDELYCDEKNKHIAKDAEIDMVRNGRNKMLDRHATEVRKLKETIERLNKELKKAQGPRRKAQCAEQSVTPQAYYA
jgi:uncharacterized protein YkvS